MRGAILLVALLLAVAVAQPATPRVSAQLEEWEARPESVVAEADKEPKAVDDYLGGAVPLFVEGNYLNRVEASMQMPKAQDLLCIKVPVVGGRIVTVKTSPSADTKLTVELGRDKFELRIVPPMILKILNGESTIDGITHRYSDASTTLNFTPATKKFLGLFNFAGIIKKQATKRFRALLEGTPLLQPGYDLFKDKDIKGTVEGIMKNLKGDPEKKKKKKKGEPACDDPLDLGDLTDMRLKAHFTFEEGYTKNGLSFAPKSTALVDVALRGSIADLKDSGLKVQQLSLGLSKPMALFSLRINKFSVSYGGTTELVASHASGQPLDATHRKILSQQVTKIVIQNAKKLGPINLQDVLGVEGTCKRLEPAKPKIPKNGPSVASQLAKHTGMVGSLNIGDVQVSIKVPGKQPMVCLPFLEIRTVRATTMTVGINREGISATLQPAGEIRVLFIEKSLVVKGFFFSFREQMVKPVIIGPHAKDIQQLGVPILNKKIRQAMEGTRMQDPKYSMHADSDPLATLIGFWNNFGGAAKGKLECSFEQTKICSGTPMNLAHMSNPTVLIDLLADRGYNVDNAHLVRLDPKSKISLKLDVEGTVKDLTKMKGTLSHLAIDTPGLHVLGANIQKVSVAKGGVVDGVLQRTGHEPQKISDAPTVHEFIGKAFRGVIQKQCEKVLGPLHQGMLCQIMGVERSESEQDSGMAAGRIN